MSAVVGATPIDAVRPFLLRVTLEGAEGDGLLRVASALHRRQLEIRQAGYERVATLSCMEILIETTAARVQTALHMLRMIVGVTDCEIVPGAPESRVRVLPRHPDRAALSRVG